MNVQVENKTARITGSTKGICFGRTSLLQRFATADGVAAMAAYTCSTLAGATNGAALRVDGSVVRGTI